MKKTTLLICTTLLLLACSKNLETETAICATNDPLNDLAWLQTIKEAFEQASSNKKIIQYTYKNNFVYLIDGCYNCPDNLLVVYNCLGEKICEFGGISGTSTCPDFYEQATNKITLWEN